ncbi:MAG: HD domain-containing protein [Nitrospirae bacterium]|nr:HD domain-containing protein [Nitrospirota bacterium]
MPKTEQIAMNPKVELYEDRLSFLNKKIPVSEKLKLIHQIIRNRVTCVDRIAVILHDSKSDLLKTFIYSSDEDHPLIRYQAKLSKVKSLKTIMESEQARVVNDLTVFEGGRAEHTKRIASQGFGSSYTLPMFLNGQFLGFVFFNSYEKNSFQAEILGELNFFGHFISSLVSTELASIRMMLSTIQAAKEISSYHHLETGQHIDRVSHYARLIAQEIAPLYGFSDEYIENIFLFSPLHDIGKVGVPENLLKKNEKLSGDEIEGLKKHVIIGRKIIDSIIKDFGLDTLPHATMLRNMAEYHHETLDGSGYVLGLQGQQIPIEARIISVADIFDALTSSRSYKTAWSNDEAFAMLQQLAGIKLDKDCVRALTQNPEKVREIQEGFKESLHPPMIGKRRYPRIKMAVKGDFRILLPEKDKKIYPIRTKNLGRNGLMFDSSVLLAVGTPLQVRLYPFSDEITFIAVVAWIEPGADVTSRIHHVGIEFKPIRQASLLLIDFLLQAPPS